MQGVLSRGCSFCTPSIFKLGGRLFFLKKIWKVGAEQLLKCWVDLMDKGTCFFWWVELGKVSCNVLQIHYFSLEIWIKAKSKKFCYTLQWCNRLISINQYCLLIHYSFCERSYRWFLPTLFMVSHCRIIQVLAHALLL